MSETTDRVGTISRTATCACGALQATVAGAPMNVHTCSCAECQRDSGSAFTYTAFFPESAVQAIRGEYRNWRRTGNLGRWVDTSFCPTCGTAVFRHWEALPVVFGVPVGCFADPSFERPAKLYYAARRHRWLVMPEDVEAIDTQ